MVGYFLQNDRRDLILSPFQDSSTYASWDDQEPYCWVVSGSLDSEKIEKGDRTVFSQIDVGVNRWIQEKKYIPHLLISALVFLVVYLFFSLVVRDPIPMIDELLIAGGTTVFCWIWLSQRDSKGALATKKKMELKQRVNEASFHNEPIISVLEGALDNLDKTNLLDLSDYLTLCSSEGVTFPSFEEVSSEDKRILKDFNSSLANLLKVGSPKNSAMLEEIIKCRKNGSPSAVLSGKLVESGLDISLLAFSVLLNQV